jgi:hypothetical protein
MSPLALFSPLSAKVSHLNELFSLQIKGRDLWSDTRNLHLDSSAVLWRFSLENVLSYQLLSKIYWQAIFRYSFSFI